MAKAISRADLLAILKPGIEQLFGVTPPDYTNTDMQKYQIEVADEEDDDKRETKTSE